MRDFVREMALINTYHKSGPRIVKLYSFLGLGKFTLFLGGVEPRSEISRSRP